MTRTIVHTTRTTEDSAFSAGALLGYSRDEVFNMGVQLLAQFIAGEPGKTMTVELADGIVRTVHFH